MKKSSKQLLFERMHSIGGMPLNENQYVDAALDKISRVGGFKNLPEIDKLALLGSSGDEEKLKHLDLGKIFKENGGTFGRFNIKVRIKNTDEQPVQHRFSQESAGKAGWLYPYINYSDNNEPYVTVRFEEFNSDMDMRGGGTYNEMPIMLRNMYPIDYTEIKSEFVDYDNKVDYDRKEFLKNLGMDDDEL